MNEKLEKHLKKLEEQLEKTNLNDEEVSLVRKGYEVGFKVGFVTGKYTEKMDVVYEEWLKDQEGDRNE